MTLDGNESRQKPSISSIASHSPSACVHVSTLGQDGHGKTTLLAAMTRVLMRANDANVYLTVDQLESIPGERVRGISLAQAEATYLLGERPYIHTDYRSHAESLKGLIAGLHPLDGVILVVSDLDGPQPQTLEQVSLASRLKVPALLVFINEPEED